MEKPYLLHFATPGNRVSPFDVNMAYDAGWNAVIPYAGVGLDEIADFTQDAIFSRGPKGARRTGIFIGGRDAVLASDMLQRARRPWCRRSRFPCSPTPAAPLPLPPQ